jgi:hypothetical protein
VRAAIESSLTFRHGLLDSFTFSNTRQKERDKAAIELHDASMHSRPGFASTLFVENSNLHELRGHPNRPLNAQQTSACGKLHTPA